jgi:chromosome segregation ATPase
MEQPALSASEAAEGVKRIHPLLLSFITLAETLEHIGDIDQAVQESQLRLKTSRDEEAALRSTITGLQADIAAAQSKMTEIEDAALAKMEQAENQAFRIAEEATHKAAELTSAAEEAGRKIFAQAQAKVDDLQDTINERGEALARAQSEVFAKGEELAALHTSIAETKAQMKKLLQQAE